MTIEKNGETYYSSTEAAEYLGISRPTFNRNVKPQLREYRYGALMRIYYRQVDLDHFRGMKEVDQNYDHR
jgi:excisionase family DNA binding protein